MLQSLRVKTSVLLSSFAKSLKEQETLLNEFDEGLWSTLVDFMTVYGKDDIGVTFKGGTEIRM